MKNKIDFFEILIWIITLIISGLFLSLTYYYINEFDYVESYVFYLCILLVFGLFTKINKKLKRRRKNKIKMQNDIELQEYINVYTSVCKENHKKDIVAKFINDINIGLAYDCCNSERKDEIKKEYINNANFDDKPLEGLHRNVLVEYNIYDNVIRGNINNVNIEFVDLYEGSSLRHTHSRCEGL